MALIAICLIPLPFVLLLCLLADHDKTGSWADHSRAFRPSSDRSSSRWKHFDAALRRKLEPASWPLTVVQLARAYLNGEDCGFALHDALLETGKPDIADVFDGPNHPQRVWVAEEIVQQGSRET